MQLSTHFTLAELTRTSQPFDNTPPERVVERLRRGAVQVLQPFRDAVGRLRVNSGYRSPRVNAAVGGVPTSQHVDGTAADVVPLDMDKGAAWQVLLTLGLPIDQAIIYERRPHIHLSWTLRPTGVPRRQRLVAVADGRFVAWSTYTGPLKPPS